MVAVNANFIRWILHRVCLWVFFRSLCSLHTLAYANRVYATLDFLLMIFVNTNHFGWILIYHARERKNRRPRDGLVHFSWYQLQARHFCCCCCFTAKSNEKTQKENEISVFVQFRSFKNNNHLISKTRILRCSQCVLIENKARRNVCTSNKLRGETNECCHFVIFAYQSNSIVRRFFLRKLQCIAVLIARS